MPRNHRKGISMLSISTIVVGILMGLVFIATISIAPTCACSLKSKLDGERLNKFVDEVREAIKEPEKRQALLEIPEQPSSRDLFVQMYDRKIISLDNIKKLAGVSGNEAPDDWYLLENSGKLTTEHIIFSTAKSGQAFLELLEGDAKSDGVAIAYNRRWLYQYPGTVVVFFAGENRVSHGYEGSIDREFSKRGILTDELRFDRPELIYGVYPFAGVAPE